MTLSVDIRHRFAGFALDARFETPPGVTVLFGRSGSGKTTVVNAVAGLLSPEAGRIAIGDEVMFDSAARINLPPRRRRIGYIFQEGRLFPHLTVRQNLRYGGWFAPRGASRASFAHVVEMLGIGDLLERRPALLSGGEKQRVAIGRALLSAPHLILADEPLAALDEPRKAEILPYFERLRDELSVPVLYVSHSPSEVARIATSVVVMERGRVERTGLAAEVLGDPAARPLGVRAVGALVAARVVARHADGLAELAISGGRLLLPDPGAEIGAALRLRIPGQEVIIAHEAPRGISALNVLPARVRRIRPGDGPGAVVALTVGTDVILSRVTQRSVAALGLAPGQDCFAIIKALAIAPEDVGAG